MPHPIVVAGTALVFCLLACGPVMLERDGHRVFNPSYAPFLDYQRDEWQLPEEVIASLALPADAVVADIGAGTGYFTERFSRRLVAGRVYATDAQPEMIERLQERVRERDLDNVVVLQVGFDAPGLPALCCDLVFFSSVYKEIDGRVAYMRRVRGALRSGGRVVILEFRPGHEGGGPPGHMLLSAEAIISELEEAGFALDERHDFLPRENFLVFSMRDD